MKQAMIFAAGLGTRLKPLTDHTPKALIPVDGQPLLYHVIEKLKRAGMERIVVNVHHFADQIKDYLRQHSFGVEILISDESDHLLNTGGGVKHARALFEDGSPVLIHNVDILSNAALEPLYEEAQTADAVLLVSERVTKRYLLFNDEMRLVGWTNIETGEIKSPCPNLNVADCRRLAFSGIHVVGANVMKEMDLWPDEFSVTDFYIQSCDKLCIKGVASADLRLMDVGKLNTLHEASGFLQSIQ